MTTWLPAPKRTVTALASAAAVVLSLWVSPTLAKDPFRANNPRPIGDNTEAAFEYIFKAGNYKAAKGYLEKAEQSEPNEPLTYAMLASLAFTTQEWDTLKSYAAKTQQTAQKLKSTDPLRGNLYTAVGHFLEGTYEFKTEGPVGAVSKLQKVFQYLDEAKKIDPNDPELNLLTGYMDLMLAVNLPFSDPAQAVEKLEKYAAPSYLAYRGIAVGYRDLKKYSKALEFVDRALKLTPNNPEVLYLKAQILRNQGKNKEAQDFFNKAGQKLEQLPNYSAAQITYEQCRNQNRIDNGSEDKGWNCAEERNKIRQRPN
ncbi:Sll0314/Alr1548 family TPR repeat-containing protein [Allocoleopsis franciscana]|uniref:Tetratricopeptide repeat protein n=1 Tax=Allocoleopsis franciscana PCC 7113 TaxID=1173027 RepID=K9W6Z4_9CYAN|nr:Sll0314/Alr1548 family TPR repeat-containing protein [Allocoleopsis franciscana]AFZ15993.1 tetratricopeptide repeat protein [Allocoleopsis franciscana PCC 7113]